MIPRRPRPLKSRRPRFAAGAGGHSPPGGRPAWPAWAAGAGCGPAAGDGLPWPLRAAHRLNERVFGAAFAPSRLAPSSRRSGPASRGSTAGTAGRSGRPVRPIRVEQPGEPARVFTAAQVVAGLPRVEMTTEFKCVEGWSQVVTWGGVSFADFVRRLGTGADRHPYVALETADGTYYVGLDAPAPCTRRRCSATG